MGPPVTAAQFTVAGAVIAGLLTVGLLFLAEPWLRHRRILDVPNARSSHDRPVLRGGGVGPAVAIVVTVALLPVVHPGTRDAGVLWTCAGAVALFAALGWLEDVRGARTAVRAAGQLLLSVSVVAVLSLLARPPLLLAIGAVVAVAAFVNVANFMDGLNGLSGCFGAVAGVVYVGIGLVRDLPWLAGAAAAVAAAFAAFLPWNAVRPRLFLGDVGSYALGAAVAVLGVAAAFAGIPLPAVVAPVLVYLVDTGYTLLRRVRAGERWYEAHRSHIYQRLNQAGRGHVAVAAYVAGTSAVCGLAGLAWIEGGTGARLAAAAVTVAAIGFYVASPRLLRSRSSLPGQGGLAITSTPGGGA